MSCCSYWGKFYRFAAVWRGGWRGTVYRCACGKTEIRREANQP